MKDNKGTIVYFGNFEMPDKDASAHRVLNNAKILREIGYTVVFCGVDKTEGTKCRCTRVENFYNYPRKYPKNNKEWIKDMISFSYYKKCLERFKNVKYVVLYDFHALPFMYMYSFCHKKGIKIIADITEWYENPFSFNPKKMIKWIDTNLMMRYLYKKVDSMIVISEYLKKYYSKYISNIIVIPPLVDISEDIWTQKNIKSTEKIEYVYSGTTDKSKDKLGFIIDCFASLDDKYDYLLTIYGLTKDQFIFNFPQSIHSMEKIGNKIRFMGYVSHSESISALLRADYCIFIRDRSRKNMAGFPTKFVECYTSGIKIIASDVSNIKDYFPKEKNNYLIKNQKILPKVLAHSLESEKNNEDKAIRTLFDFREWINLLNDLMS